MRLLIGATLEIASSQDHDPVLVSEEDGNTGTFGTFAPPPRINEEQGDEEDDPLGGEPLTEEELRKNRLPDNGIVLLRNTRVTICIDKYGWCLRIKITFSF